LSYILHICSWFPHEGDPQNGVFIRQHIELSQDSFQPLVICNTPKGSKEIASNKIAVFNLNSTPSKWSKFWSARKFFKNLLKDKGQPKAIHLHVVSPLGIIALLASSIFKCQLLITEHWTGYRSGLYAQSSRFQKFIAHLLFRKASNVVVVSESLKNDLMHLKLVEKEKIIVAHNPISILDEQLPSKKSNSSNISMLSVADFNEKNKNFQGILSAFEKAIITIPTLHWTIIGDGPDKIAFETLLDKSAAKNRVHLLGRQPQTTVFQYYLKFDFLVSFSRFETFAMVPAEAIASGIPVIASKSGGPEYYVTAQNGILVESNNTDQLLDAIKTLSTTFSNYSTEQLRNSLPKAFSPKHFSENLVNLYNKE
jgi:glycosyltransferase involved in cell wall biosynthesis